MPYLDRVRVGATIYDLHDTDLRETMRQTEAVGPSGVIQILYGSGGDTMGYVVVDIAPTQSGSGDPSPDNIRDIASYSSVSVTVSPTDDPADGEAYTAVIPDPPGTVCSGTLDLVSGAGVADMKLAQMTYSFLSGLQSGYIGYNETVTALGGKSAVWVRNWNYSEMPAIKTGGIKAVCNAFSVHVNDYNINRSQYRIYFEVDSSITSTDDFLEAVRAMENNGGGLYIAYELATPITFQCVPQAVLSLEGANVITSNAGNVSVELPVSIMEYIRRQVAMLHRSTATELDKATIQTIVRDGQATRYFSVGDQIVTKWNDGTNEYDLPWDVVDFSPAVNANGDTVPAMWLESHYALPGLQFDASEAMYRVGSNTLPAGRYYWTFGNTWGNNVTQNASWNFTLTQDVPANGCIVVHGTASTGIYVWGAPDVLATNWRVSTFSSLSSTTPIETVTVSSGASGTSLGALQNSTAYTTEPGINQLQRAGCGYNRWSQSAMRQWLNSSAAAGAWWTPQNAYDRPPQQLATMRGFMAGLPEDFLSVVQPVKVTTALNTLTDTAIGTTEDTIDTFFLPSLEQRYIAAQLAGVEGGAFQYWKELIGTADPWQRSNTITNASLIKYQISNHATPQTIRLRSVNNSNARSVFYIHTTGYTYAENASTALSATPACVIC